ncbi:MULTISPECIES: F0F1 ATP synthase subunit epsilon [Pseudomonas]|uniref:ATP synthase epsilon chain n=1 Tax=Pseudomonas gingeri TaxID=117681 RepID=A0A7Y7WJG5_9PSED|nr:MULTISPECIES: F0F1 ATP synthase subunit epsilon [Pseudomonas]MCU1742019.1 F0F1 ATP synthase subunit epsilon [Pseudomonas sp. 20S_6.2_Bac1]NWB50434.1 F0F1 ATP synthase subunit epsilon [Pseudomonas gingeri]
MPSTSMHLKILLPFKVFAEKLDVLRIVAESSGGAFGLLPNRLDCAAALVPGILTYETVSGGEVCLAIDEGVLVKTGREVLISVRDAIGDRELGELHKVIEQEFLSRHEQEKSVRSALAKLESGFIRRFAALHHG